MRSLKQIDSEISQLRIQIVEIETSKPKSMDAKIKRIKLNIDKLEYFKLYIKSNPNEVYLREKLEKIQHRYDAIMLNFIPMDSDRFKKSDITKCKKDFEKLWGLNKIKEQIKDLNYLLNN